MSGEQKSNGKRISRRKLIASMGVIGAGAMGAAALLSAGRSTADAESWDKDSVKAFGAKGDGVADDTSAFEQALRRIKENGGGRIYVPPGTYILTRPLQLSKHTEIRMDNGAVLKKMGDPDRNLKLFTNGTLGDDHYATGYDGEGNISIIGGTIDLGSDVIRPSEPGKGYMAFAIGHADGVHIERVRFVNGCNGHIIEFNSSRNIKLLHCLFHNQLITKPGQYEMVQLDFATKEGFPSFGAYDDTPCTDVLVEGCTFRNGDRGFGTHGSKYDASGKPIFHTNIRIVNNHFQELRDVAIRPESYQHCVISGNIISGAGGHGIIAYACQHTTIVSNVLSDIGLHGIAVVPKTTDASAAYVFNEASKYVNVSGNIIKNGKSVGIRVIGGEEIVIADNFEYSVGKEGVSVSSSQYAVVKQNVIRGASQEKNGSYSAIRLEGCANAEISHNTVHNEGFSNRYSYALNVKSDCSMTAVLHNMWRKGTAGELANDASDTLVATWAAASGPAPGAVREKFLTPTINAVSGTVELNDDITKFKAVIVATGVVSEGGLVHEYARGWSSSGFRPGTDSINVATANGRFAAVIAGTHQIRITRADDPLRYLIGVYGD
ncbi:hypothetical protein PAESOLCIP111_01785 [Paenibacillus solanacearum]|uniref:Pectate lyase superfamily protein domain-containing protein n=1 Tax=Paenibacillus solanacearum TaxID=2048548 RepID=A0A916NIA0_9BACL|nr:glycosyl hydrolase family 28-related protein [Paenibacillus solanacearum]CAG7615169.1 hypothetical protein PAESOLCIP111_01785 [Paenibacillus solanacearum]